MPQDLSSKRIEIVGIARKSATGMYGLGQGLVTAKAYRDQSGTFTDAEIQAVSGLEHLTAYMVGLLLDTLVSDLNTWLDANVTGTSTKRRDLLVQMIP